MRRLLLAAVFVAGCGGGTVTVTHDLTGSLTLEQDEKVEKTEGTCSGTGGYADMHDGGDVIVRDGAGVIIAKGRLTFAPRPDETAILKLDEYRWSCPFAFAIRDVSDADFYVLTIGRRPDLTYSRAEMEAMGWKVELTLGP